MGSVTAKVLHDAGCPVWTGPHLEQAPDYRKIAFEARAVRCRPLRCQSRSACLGRPVRAANSTLKLDIVHVLPHALVELGGLYFDAAWRQHAAEVAYEQMRAAAGRDRRYWRNADRSGRPSGGGERFGR
ncbi:MAG: hypothetical protein WDO73_37795 [Ignavibacteriota bacterium]